ILVLTGVNEDKERKCSSLPNSAAKCVSLTKKKQFFINQAICNSDLTPRAKGKKNQRRQENSCYLANLLDRNECSKDEAEVGFYWSQHLSKALLEQEKLQALLEEAKRNNCNKLLKDQREGESPGHFYFPRSHWFRVHVRYLEENILSFFGAQPHSVYVTNLGSRYFFPLKIFRGENVDVHFGLSSVYHAYLVTTQLIGSNALRRKERNSTN
uniref:R3H-associated N-terminal domain-containing protein n=1 Tax=Oncorhynchus tshawytscha TaxID=74940 RepID=A0A8C8GRS6_ONCTS